MGADQEGDSEQSQEGEEEEVTVEATAAEEGEDEDGGDEQEEASEAVEEGVEEEGGAGEEDVGDAHSTSDSLPHPQPSSSRSKAAVSSRPPLSSTSLSSFDDSLASTGLLYFSRLPPHLKPMKLRQLLSCYGAVNRVFCTPDKRGGGAKASGGRPRRYVEGWVEFEDKKIAKAVALTLNGTNIGGRKRGYWYDDVWSVRYLKGFKWHDSTARTPTQPHCPPRSTVSAADTPLPSAVLLCCCVAV